MAPATRPADATSVVPFCFAVTGRMATPAHLRLGPARLPAKAAEALAVLLPLLGCGEEAAAMAFDALAESALLPETGDRLATIAAEERVHDALLRDLQTALPVAAGTGALIRSARRFHIRLEAGGPMAHLARIAALDSAVCTVLSRLTCDRGVVALDPRIHRLLRRIHKDEARHVAVSRTLVLHEAVTVGLRDVAAAAREQLANTLGLAGHAFEALGVDPAVLDRRIRILPDGLLPA